MTIPEIKSQLPILTVLASYGLEPGKGNALKCPFHADGKASMKIYPETNTAYCFAGSCEVKSVDVIDHDPGKNRSSTTDTRYPKHLPGKPGGHGAYAKRERIL
jgi:hypothetical protein